MTAQTRLLVKKRHNVVLCGASGRSVGASCRGQPGRVSTAYVRSRVVFQSDSVPTSRDFAAPSKPPRPGASSFGRLVSDAYLFSRLAARSRVPLVRHRLRPRRSCRVPFHAPPRGLPPGRLRGGCPATARLAARLNLHIASQTTANTEAPFRCASRIFCESQAARAAGQ